MKRHKIKASRAMQIMNNVSEEYIDLGQTGFATPKEFCETILYLNDLSQRHLRRKDRALDSIAIKAMKARLYR